MQFKNMKPGSQTEYVVFDLQKNFDFMFNINSILGKISDDRHILDKVFKEIENAGKSHESFN